MATFSCRFWTCYLPLSYEPISKNKSLSVYIHVYVRVHTHTHTHTHTHIHILEKPYTWCLFLSQTKCTLTYTVTLMNNIAHTHKSHNTYTLYLSHVYGNIHAHTHSPILPKNKCLPNSQSPHV